MADIKDRNSRRRLQKFCRISTLKSSNVPIGSADLWSCQNDGSSSAPSLGSIAVEGSPRIGRTQQKGARVLAPRLNPPHAQKTLQSGLKSPDGLLGLPAENCHTCEPERPVIAITRD